MAFFILFGIAVILVISPLARCIFFNPIKVISHGCRDIYFYFRYKKYNNAKFGYIRCYTAGPGRAFGSGKTLMGTHDIVDDFNRYNNKPVWCKRRMKFVRQRIHILSNVDFLTVPSIHMDSLKDFVDVSHYIDAYDDEHDTLTITIAFCDEASSQMNSRDFKSNFDPLFLSTLLTSRHFRASFYLTSQKFFMVDKLMRSCVSEVYSTDKLWRFQRYSVYDADELENATNELMIQPLRKGCWFVTDKDYAAYDTYACVGKLIKDCETGNRYSETEILERLGSTDSDVAAVTKFDRKYKRRHKKMN